MVGVIMSDNMSDMMKNLSNMLGGKEIPDNVKDIFSSMMNNSSNASNTSNVSSSSRSSNASGSSTNSNTNNDFSNIDINTIMKMQQIVKSINSEQSSSRVNLLRSLKPYLKPSRQDKVEQYIQLFNMEKVFEMMNHDGGGKK